MFRMSRRSILFVGFVVLAGVAGQVNADTAWTDNFDSGYTNGATVVGISGWVDASGTGATNSGVYTTASTAQASSGTFSIVSSIGRSNLTHPTGVGPNDSWAAYATMEATADGHGSGFGVCSTPVWGDGQRIWTIGGHVSVQWYQDPNDHTYDGLTLDTYDPAGGSEQHVFQPEGWDTNNTWYDLRLSAPASQGVTLVTLDWKLHTDSSWTTLGTINTTAAFSAANFGITMSSNAAMDNCGFSSITNVPEPSSIVLALGGLVGLLAYAWRKRR
jgi:hypothetical protein